MGSEKRLVPRLTAAYQIGQQHGDSLAGGLGDADAAGLGHQQVGAVHILCHPGGEAHRLHPQQTAHLQGVEHLAVAAAQHRGIVPLRQQLVQPAGQLRHGPAADAAAHQQDVPPLRRQLQLPPGGGPIHRRTEHAAGGNTGGQQRLRRHTAADKLLRQLLMGNNADVRRTAAHGGRAGVVRGHEAERHGRAAVLPEHGHHQRRDHMDAHHGVAPLGLQITVQPACAPGQIAVDRVVFRHGAARLLLGGHVPRLVEVGVVAV